MRIIISDTARKDLRDIKEYIYENSPKAAEKVVAYIIDRIETLLPPNPAIGRLTKVIRTRELVINKYPYIVPYRVQNGELHILRILHTSRKWEDN